VLVARKAKELDETAQEVKKINPNVKILTRAIDIRSEDDVKSLYASIKEEFGTVDVLINNAGSGKSALPVKDVGPKDFWYDFVSAALITVVMGRVNGLWIGSERQRHAPYDSRISQTGRRF
jgi:NADP-dependent 3-hydroxy acid dehydrogenase YdfG